MVRSRYSYLIKQRPRWFVRIVVPPDVRDIIGQSIFKVPTGHSNEHRAATVAAPIIAELRQRVAAAREAGRRLEQVTADQLAERYRAEREADPERAEITKVTDVIKFVLAQHGNSWADVPDDRDPFAGRRVRNPAYRRKNKDKQRQRFRPEDVVQELLRLAAHASKVWRNFG